jgi:drug/metabolite transporter (DMT)-like permease
MTSRTVRRRATDQTKVTGAAAVVGVVLAFSLSSTLAKRAHTPGVLIAFWRMLIVSIIWNVYARASGRHVTIRHVRQVWVPGALLGLNLAAFFAGATHNSVANAALLGSLSPFLIVPISARLFRERIHPSALLCAIAAFAGLTIVIANAPPAGDASTRGNILGAIAMIVWVGYVTTTRRYRQDIDVTTFMATISPIATIAILPLAVTNGGLLDLTRTGWTYTIILAVLNGIGAHGLMVYAQRSVGLGTIGIVQTIQPALAVVWSYLLLSEHINARQGLGIAIVIVGSGAFVMLHQHTTRPARPTSPC